MAKFNEKVTLASSLAERSDATLNKAGGIAFSPDAKTELFLRCATMLPGEDKFYASGSQSMAELLKMIGDVMVTDPEFVLKLAVFTRNDLYMRHTPLFLVAEYARFASRLRAGVHPAREILDRVQTPSKYVDAVIQRADEITSLVSICLTMNKNHEWQGKLPMMIKRGVASAFNKFDEYQYGKYGRAPNVSVTMRDALFLTHPKAKSEEQQKIFDKIASDSIPIPATWEQEIMQKGSTAETWSDIIPRMGYMALLRNLRNFIEKDVPREVLEGVAKRIASPVAIAQSKQFPFRFYSAYRSLNYDTDLIEFRNDANRRVFEIGMITNAVRTAMEISAANVPVLPGRSVIFIDVSGSMKHKVSDKSVVTLKDIATLYGAIFNKITENAVVGVFADEFAIVPLAGKDILPAKEKIDSVKVGGNTNAYKAFEWLVKNKIEADRVFLLSDMQHWNTMRHGSGMVANHFINWKREVSPDAYLYSIDLAGYGTTSFPKDTPGVVTIAGWSEKIFHFATCFEKKDLMISMIDRIKV